MFLVRYERERARACNVILVFCCYRPKFASARAYTIIIIITIIIGTKQPIANECYRDGMTQAHAHAVRESR